LYQGHFSLIIPLFPGTICIKRRNAQLPLSEHPIADSYWVLPGQLLAGEYPGDLEDEQARYKLRRLLEAGITLFLDLTEEGEHALRPYAHLLQKEAAALGRSATHFRLPIPDYGAPSSAQMKRIMDLLDAGLQSEQIIYVHCYGGIGRTGTVVGCFLVRHGLSGEAALAHIAALRRDTPDSWKHSPETDKQRQMVLGWQG
jgi:hypothetical protein